MSLLLFIIAQVVPWYLFPGTAQADTSRKTPTVIKDTAVAFRQVVPNVSAVPADSLEGVYVYEPVDTVKVFMAMPMTESNTGNLDFYLGALIAARDLGNSGMSILLNVTDIPESSYGAMAGSDVILGPIAFHQVRDAASVCPYGKMVISPLEQKAITLVDSLPVLQTPTPQDEQLRDLARWAVEGMGHDCRIAVIIDSFGDNSNVVVSTLQELGIPFITVTGSQMLANACNHEGETRFITTSVRESFALEAVRSVSVLAKEQHRVSIYCPSKVKSFENLNVELLHSSNAHIVTVYNVDYNAPDVRRFIYAFRALFNTEPNSFAFHGYDTMNYFSKVCSTYGKQWYKKLEDYTWKGLQSDFRLIKKGNGAINHGSRRIVYNPDFTISTL